MNRTQVRALIGGAVAFLLLVAPASAGVAAPHAARAAKFPVSSIDKTKAMSAADRAAIDAVASKAVADSLDKAPGLWLAVWDPKKGYYEQAYGQAVVGGAAATVADHFMIGSITKTVFATAVLQQVAKGRLALSDTVRKLDPALARKFPKAARYTVAQLLSMRTQIPDYADPAVAIQVADPQHHFTRNDLIALGFAQGKKQPAIGGYSTTNYILLGVILAKLTGATPESLVNGVFRQAGMTQSRLPTTSGPLPAPAAHGYVGAVYGSQFVTINPGVTATTDVSSWAFDWGKEGGGAYSTIGDLATWGGTCLGNSLLPKSMVAKRLVFTALNVGDYGRGIIRQGSWLAHAGQAIGYEANVACNPKTGAVAVWAVNSTEGSLMLNDVIGPVVYPDYYAATQLPKDKSRAASPRLAITKHALRVPRFQHFSFQTAELSGVSAAATAAANSRISALVHRTVAAARKPDGSPCMAGEARCGYFVQSLELRTCVAGVVCVAQRSGLLPVGANDGQAGVTTLAIDAVTGAPVPLGRVLPAAARSTFVAGLTTAVRARLAAAGLADDPYWSFPVALKDVHTWLPQPDGIHVWFDKYAVAPGSLGIIHVVVPWPTA